ncbi:MAG: 23S rRNA (uracil(1939)-C(5))-methyltransferase RlmD [Clostridia bacterium]|nr:23S rRNA (uracil(1939)-C(5))-methyltransferase RlmD [Clostridia bacterium]
MAEVVKNEEYTIEITGMTHEGQGVGRVNNFTVFIDGALVGEKVRIKVIKINKNYGVGKLLEILTPSSQRTTPFCAHYKRCGGCGIQHMNYQAQLQFKTNTVKDNIRRLGKLEDVVIHDTIGMENAMNYRNKAQYPVGQVKGNTLIGFYATRSHDIIDITSCGIQSSVSDKVRQVCKDFIIKNNIEIYDEEKGTGLIRHIMTRVGYKTGEVMVVVVINKDDLPRKQQLVKELTSAIPEIRSILLNINKKKTNVILGDRNVKLYGEEVITDYIGRYKFNISPLSFFQVNPVQTEVLYSKALEYAGLTGKETVFDLYCGIGTISLFLSEKAKKVYGVEVVEEAIDDARENARINGVENIEFMVGEAERVIPEVYKSGVTADVVVVDPPRKGCDEVLLETLVDMQPQRIVYVSCNPSTLARDLKYLEEKGYKAVEVQPVDMFPQTAHVETVVLIERK